MPDDKLRVRSSIVISAGMSVLLVVAQARIAFETTPVREARAGTAVVAAPSDPYYGLAQQIAREENVEIVEQFDDVLLSYPTFVILVASPANLSIEKLASIGSFFKSQDYYPALGIISGFTLDAAQKLWERRHSAKAGNNFVGGDVEVPQRIFKPTIFNISDGVPAAIPLNENTLIESLRQADYFYWTRHSGGKTWYWNDGAENWGENDELSAREIPGLRPAVIYSPTCSIFRPWLEDSIALSFIDKGAAAFLGFVNSPYVAAFSKSGLSVPGLTSWKDFPLGLVAQVQNKTTAKIIYHSPQFFMLGDPRIYLSIDQPYQIISDRVVADGKRVIDGHSDRQGVLAVKITNAAQDDFLSIEGLTYFSENDIFYNNKIQTLNLGRDKYVLLLHPGGNFHIQLLKQAPTGWVLADALIDALDYAWVVLWLDVYSDANPYLYIASVIIFICIALFKTLRQKRPLKAYVKIFLVALLIALLRLAYCLLRLNGFTISSNIVDYSAIDLAIGFAGVFCGVAGGLMLMKDGNSIVVKCLGVWLAVLRQSWMAAFYLGFVTLLNNVPQVTQMTAAGIWNYSIFWLALISLVVEVFIILAAFRTVASRRGNVPGYRARSAEAD